MRTGSVEGQGLCHTEVNHFCKRVTVFTSFFVDQYHAHQVEKCIYTVYSIHIFHVYNKYIYILLLLLLLLFFLFLLPLLLCACVHIWLHWHRTFRYRYASHIIVARLGAPCLGPQLGMPWEVLPKFAMMMPRMCPDMPKICLHRHIYDIYIYIHIHTCIVHIHIISQLVRGLLMTKSWEDISRIYSGYRRYLVGI